MVPDSKIMIKATKSTMFKPSILNPYQKCILKQSHVCLKVNWSEQKIFKFEYFVIFISGLFFIFTELGIKA